MQSLWHTEKVMAPDFITIIKDIGIEDKESRTYIALLEIGTGTAQHIAARANLKRTTVYPALERLISLGLIRRDVVGSRTMFIPQPPSELIRLAQMRFERLKDHAHHLDQLAHSANTKEEIKELVYTTRDDVYDIICALITAHNNEKCVIEMGGKKYALVRTRDSRD